MSDAPKLAAALSGATIRRQNDLEAWTAGDQASYRRGTGHFIRWAKQQKTSAWLFPGGHPGRPISSHRLAERLREHGIYSGWARSTALFQLATALPVAVPTRLLGIHITVAAAWQRASSGDWTNYAAEVSRRTRELNSSQPERARRSEEP